MCFLLNAQICERLFHRKYLGKADFCTGFQFSSNLHLTGFGAFLHNSVLIDSSDIFIAAGPGKAGWIKNWACIHVWTVVVGIQQEAKSISPWKRKAKRGYPNKLKHISRTKKSNKGADFTDIQYIRGAQLPCFYICMKIHPRREKRKAILLKEILQAYPYRKNSLITCSTPSSSLDLVM